MQERRKFPRKRTTKLLEVVDVNTNEPVGNVVDISLAGIMLICSREIEDNSVFQLALKMPEDYEEDGQIELGAEVLWSEKSSGSNQSWVGFHIIDISEEAQSRYKAFIDKYF